MYFPYLFYCIVHIYFFISFYACHILKKYFKILLSLFCVLYLKNFSTLCFLLYNLNNSNMKNVKRCLPRIALDPNASSIIIGLFLFFWLPFFLSLTHFRFFPATSHDYRMANRSFTRRVELFQAQWRIAQLSRSRKRKTAHKSRRLYLSSVRASYAKCLEQRDLECNDNARIEIVAFKRIEL